jgi:hypothetical protein
MKLGTQTNSLVNHMYARGTIGQPVPEVGMGATILMWTDRKAATIVDVLNDGKVVIVQPDRAIRVDNNGMSECQDYRFEPDPSAGKQRFKFDGQRWRELYLSGSGRWCMSVKGDGNGLRIGSRDHYHDFSF